MRSKGTKSFFLGAAAMAEAGQELASSFHPGTNIISNRTSKYQIEYVL
jgi:hypothetical protein